jgi:RHS repeat-associated protein
VTGPDSTVTFTYYSGNRALVKDPAGKERLSATDALGRLTDVWEITSTDLGTYPSTDPAFFPGHGEVSAGYHTSYGYDPLDDLTTATQGSQNRTFTFDGMKRLLSANNPESGLISFLYDNNGNLTQKTDPRATGSSHVQINYRYDALNRLLTRSYTIPAGISPQIGATPNVTYRYEVDSQGTPITNAIGRLTGVTSSASTYTHDSFDALGRVTKSTQTTNTTAYPIIYTYDLAGEMLTEQYPSGTTIATGYDQTGRVNSVSRTAPAAKTYASLINYAPQGAISSVTLGNSLIEKTAFNNRLQATEILLGTSGSSASKLDLVFTYNTPGNTDNNGNMLTQTISAASAVIASQTYTYDALNRLATASETGGWSQTSNYDRTGNRWVTNPTGINLNPLTPTAQTDYNSANNKIAASTYDTAGNQYIDKQGNSYFYDGENHQTSSIVSGASSSYTYDGDGHRITKTTGAGPIVFVYDIGGKLIAEYNGPATNGGTSYLTTDHLGSTRLVTRSDQSVVSRHDYLPFGEEIALGIGGRTTPLGYGTSDDTRQKFTSKERDNESGLDYFGARYYSSNQARFTSVDPSRNGVELNMPQTWNRYSYSNNNPLLYVDRNGKWPTETHNRIIERALSKLAPNAVKAIQQGSYSVDSCITCQLMMDSHKHAMVSAQKVLDFGGGKEGYAKARDWAKGEMNKFIQGKLTEAKNDLAAFKALSEYHGPQFGSGRPNTGDLLTKAWEAFGEAIHPIMDKYSPAHRDWQVYSTFGWDLSPLGIINAYNDITDHQSREARDPTPEEMNQMTAEIQGLYKEVFGPSALAEAAEIQQQELGAEIFSGAAIRNYHSVR